MKILKWINYDGILHITCSCLIMLVASLYMGMQWALSIVLFVDLGKEIKDYINGNNNLKQIFHDVVCDLIGIVVAMMVYLTYGG